MDRSDFEKTLRDEGITIFHGFERLVSENPKLIKLRKTGNGFHLCLIEPNSKQLIEFIQIWGDPMQRLETRFSMMERKMPLPMEVRDKIWDLLRSAGFERIDGTPRNMKLQFEKVHRPYSEGGLDFLMTSIMSAVTLLKESLPKT